MDQAELDRWHMQRALELAQRGEGYVEPNPMVGCVIARGAEIVGEGWHRRFGGPHAEVEALRIAGRRASGATMYVTLEPCCHWGKTPPCTDAIVQAGIARVVVAQQDPFPQVAGKGLAALRSQGIAIEVGVLAEQAIRLNAPYLKLTRTAVPWVIAKWAMTLDGKIATSTGDSRWISSESSRRLVHQLRGRVDAVLVGSRTVQCDDPLLTPRQFGPRRPTRIVFDSKLQISLQSQLVQTARDWPVLVATSKEAPDERRHQLEDAGCEVLVLEGQTHLERLEMLLHQLGKRRVTNLLVEGGSRLLGLLFQLRQIDEVFAFVAPKIVGDAGGPSPLAGPALARMADAFTLHDVEIQQIESDVLVRGRTGWNITPGTTG